MKALQILKKINQEKLENLIESKNQIIEKINANNAKQQEINLTTQKESESFYSSDYAFMLENYLSDARAQIELLQGQLEGHNNRLRNIESNIRMQFAELKKFELILENKKKQMQKEILDRENKTIDELNINLFNKKTSNN